MIRTAALAITCALSYWIAVCAAIGLGTALGERLGG